MPPDVAQVETTSLTQRLRTATHDAHVRLEQSLDIMRPDLTMSQYVQQLGRWLGFCRTWEAAGESVFKSKLRPFFRARRKTPLIVKDLLACGVPAVAIAKLPAFSSHTLDFANPSSAFGTLYVIEGSTLGGAYIAKHVEARLALTTQSGLSFFMSYGALRGKHWADTKQLLNHPTFPINRERMIQSAVATFEHLGEWLPAIRT